MHAARAPVLPLHMEEVAAAVANVNMSCRPAGHASYIRTIQGAAMYCHIQGTLCP